MAKKKTSQVIKKASSAEKLIESFAKKLAEESKKLRDPELIVFKKALAFKALRNPKNI